VAIIVALALFLAPVSAQAQTGRAAVHDLVGLFSSWDGKRVNADLSGAAAKHIDYSGMAARAIGQAEWDKLNPGQQREFVATFRKLVERRYYPRWHKLFRKGNVSYLSESNTNGDVLVRTRLLVGKKRDTLIWQLHPDHGDLMVINLIVGQKNLLGRLTERFHRLLKDDGFEGMMAWLKDKLDEDNELHSRSGTPTASRS
jgi:ABC-type transporter MlaC component